jgi:hypothetical protein
MIQFFPNHHRFFFSFPSLSDIEIIKWESITQKAIFGFEAIIYIEPGRQACGGGGDEKKALWRKIKISFRIDIFQI